MQPSHKETNLSHGKRTYWKGTAVLLVCVFVSAFVYDFVIQKNFDVVVPGKLYRSGQPSASQLENWIKRYNLKSILSLRHSMPEYEKEIANRYGVKIYRIIFSAKQGLTEQQWKSAEKILTDESNQPLLIHCQSGVDRTGLVSALYRVEEQNWPLNKALGEMILQYYIPFQYPVLQQQLRERYQEKHRRDALHPLPGNP